MKLENKKRYIIALIVAIIIILSLGTYAWLTYRTNDTAMVLTVGDINNVRITMSPYQIDANLSPNLTYTGQPYTTIEVINNSSSPRNIKLFYTINAIDSELATSNLKYTIEKKAVGASSFTHITPDGNFSGTNKGSVVTIVDEAAPVGTTYYKVYVWLYSASSNQNNVPGKKFNAELNATIGENQYVVTLDANNGTVSPETIVVNANGTYQNLPTPTRNGYTFLGWNGKNLVSDNKIRIYSNWSTTIATNGSYPSNNSNPGFLLDLEEGKTYTITYTTPDSSTFPPYFYLCEVIDNTGNLVSYLTTTSIVKLTHTFTTETGKQYFLRMGSSNSQSAFNTNIAKLSTIMIEEGNQSTTYEPYYITNGTTVVQNQNHTLTAIWQKNS